MFLNTKNTKFHVLEHQKHHVSLSGATKMGHAFVNGEISMFWVQSMVLLKYIYIYIYIASFMCRCSESDLTKCTLHRKIPNNGILWYNFVADSHRLWVLSGNLLLNNSSLRCFYNSWTCIQGNSNNKQRRETDH